MVTDQQIRRLFKLSMTEETQEIAASKAGMDVKTARKYLKSRRIPSEMKAARHWRTRPDDELRPILDLRVWSTASRPFEAFSSCHNQIEVSDVFSPLSFLIGC